MLWVNSAAFNEPNGPSMQVSALNTIIAAQQARAASSATRPNPAQASSSASAPLAASKQPDTFAPLAFAEADKAPAATALRPAANPFVAPVSLGSQLDIRV